MQSISPALNVSSGAAIPSNVTCTPTPLVDDASRGNDSQRGRGRADNAGDSKHLSWRNTRNQERARAAELPRAAPYRGKLVAGLDRSSQRRLSVSGAPR